MAPLPTFNSKISPIFLVQYSSTIAAPWFAYFGYKTWCSFLETAPETTPQNNAMPRRGPNRPTGRGPRAPTGSPTGGRGVVDLRAHPIRSEAVQGGSYAKGSGVFLVVEESKDGDISTYRNISK